LEEGHLIREKDSFIVTQPKITAQGNNIVRSIQTFFSLTLESWAKKIHLFPVDKSVFDISYITLTEDELKKLKEYLLSVSSNIVSFESKEHSPEKKCASVGIFLLPIEWIQK